MEKIASRKKSDYLNLPHKLKFPTSAELSSTSTTLLTEKTSFSRP